MDVKFTVLSFCVLLLAVLALVGGQQSTTSSMDEECSKLNSSCQECVSNKKCFWCDSSVDKCQYNPAQALIPSSSSCPLMDVKFVTCYVNLGIVVIVCGSLAGVLLIASCVCIYCCCCRGKKGISRRELREEQAQNAEAETRRARNAERRAERQARWDEIRQKYGLSSGNSQGASYSRFDNDASEA